MAMGQATEATGEQQFQGGACRVERGAGRQIRAGRPESAGGRAAALARAARHALARHSLAARLLGLGLSSAAALAGAVGVGGCGGANDPVFDPRLIQTNERNGAEGFQPPVRPISSTHEEPPMPSGGVSTTQPVAISRPTTLPSGGLAGTEAPLTRLSLREVIQRAVANSGDVRVAGYEPAINAQKVIQQEAQFDPNFVTNLSIERQDTQTAGSIISRGTFGNSILRTNKANIYTGEAGLQQNLPYGGKISATFQVDETDFDVPTDRRVTNPYWENQLRLQVTQPLLRGFGAAVNAARITIAKDDQRISTLEFRKAVEEMVDQVEQDYWQLYEAEQEVLFDQQLVENSLQTFRILKDRELKGVDPNAGGGVPAAQAEVRVESNQAVLIAAQQRVRDISTDLKRRMNDPAFPVSAPVVLLAADNPLQVPIEFNFKDQVDTALDNRLELGEQQWRIDEAAVLLETARNGELPQLDVVATAAVQGLAGDWSPALRNFGEFNHIGYSIGLQFTYPIGNRGPKAATRQAQFQRQQAIDQYQNLVTQISADVQLNWEGVYSAYRQAERRQQSRLAAARQLQLIQNQIVIGGRALDPPFVQVQLQAQEDLALAQREESAALANYNIAIEKLERSKGTILRYDNIVLEENTRIARDNGR